MQLTWTALTNLHQWSIKCKEKNTWPSADLIDLIRNRDQFKEEADSLSENLAHEKFKEYRNKCKRQILKDKRDYIKNKLISTESNPKKYWANISELFQSKKGHDKSNKVIISLLDDTNHEVDL